MENLEKNYSNTKLDYNLNKIINELNSSLLNEMNDNKKREEDFKQKYLAIFDESSLSKLIEENKNNKNLSEFLNNKLSIISKEKQKYLENLDESSIKKLIEENKNNKIMFEFLNSKLSLFSNNSKKNISNKNFLTFCKGYKNSDELINLYASKFYIAIDFIEQIIKNILNEIYSMPKSIKKICRIIFGLTYILFNSNFFKY